MQRIFQVLAGNGVKNIWVPQGGIMSTPAVSAAIRTYEDGQAQELFWQRVTILEDLGKILVLNIMKVLVNLLGKNLPMRLVIL